eukprot:CAMPEP_0179195218 /NCGR_PEP_ID=MMETSP0796-20121207/97037_1 /TAXON_ID=73915 /ORGANISM="Pyrodinium bahamense, Strain pbaha01" /LENGTH=168 /DNA_ID=CAMNT_0020899563 /DNA_START=47 /DNA_END=555 /DNA_ORIENTATION=-
MPARSAEAYLAEHGADGSGRLPVSALGPCLEAALCDIGLQDAARRRAFAGSLVEEYCLRAEAAPVGLGALARLLEAAEVRCSTERTGAKLLAEGTAGHVVDGGGRGPPTMTPELDAAAKDDEGQEEQLASGRVRLFCRTAAVSASPTPGGRGVGPSQADTPERDPAAK